MKKCFVLVLILFMVVSAVDAKTHVVKDTDWDDFVRVFSHPLFFHNAEGGDFIFKTEIPEGNICVSINLKWEKANAFRNGERGEELFKGAGPLRIQIASDQKYEVFFEDNYDGYFDRYQKSGGKIFKSNDTPPILQEKYRKNLKILTEAMKTRIQNYFK